MAKNFRRDIFLILKIYFNVFFFYFSFIVVGNLFQIAVTMHGTEENILYYWFIKLKFSHKRNINKKH